GPSQAMPIYYGDDINMPFDPSEQDLVRAFKAADNTAQRREIITDFLRAAREQNDDEQHLVRIAQFALNLLARANEYDTILYFLATDAPEFPHKSKLIFALRGAGFHIPEEVLAAYIDHPEAMVAAIRTIPAQAWHGWMIERMVASYESQTIQWRLHILEVLMRIDGPKYDLKPALHRWVWFEDDQECRRLIYGLVGRFGDASFIDELTESMTSSGLDDIHRLEALGRIGDPRAIPALGEKIRKTIEVEVTAIIRTLGRLGGAASLEIVSRYMFDPIFQRDAIRAFVAIGGDHAREHLLVLRYHYFGRELQTVLVDALVDTATLDIAPHLVPLIYEKPVDVRIVRRILQVLGQLKFADANPDLIYVMHGNLVSSPSEASIDIHELAEIAADALQQIGTPEALEAVRNWKDGQRVSESWE
ncbi:MAG: hypothetical protein AAF125_17180, partial [Chloroflexota bacterium]